MTDWRAKPDEDLTPEDFAEMRRVARPVDVVGPPVPANGHFVNGPVTGGAPSVRTILRQPSVIIRVGANVA